MTPEYESDPPHGNEPAPTPDEDQASRIGAVDSPEESDSRIGSVDSPTESENRIGSVDLDDVFLTQAPHLEDSDDFKRMGDRLQVSEEVFASLQKRSDFHLEDLLTETLDGLVAGGNLDGMMIASDEGFVIAQSSEVDQGEILAAMGSLFESTVTRAQNESLIKSVEEMTLRGFDGEQIIVRYFPDLEREYFLVAHSAKHCAYRRDTTRALKICGELLALALRHSPDKLRRLMKRIDTLRSSRTPATPSQTERTTPVNPPSVASPSVASPSVVSPSVASPSVSSPSVAPVPASDAPAPEAPTPEAPASEAPTPEAPTPEAPTPEAPTPEAPTPEAPTSEAPTSEAPTSEAPTSEAPTSEAPTSEAPTSEAPTPEAPTPEAPATDAPPSTLSGETATYDGETRNPPNM